MNSKATLSVLAGGTLWGIINIFVKTISSYGIASLQISFVRMTIASVTLLLFTFFTDREKLRINPKDIWMFIGTGIISVAMFNTLYFYTMIHGQASVAVVLLYTSPIFIMIISRFLFKEKITGTKIIALILTFAGCVLVAGLIGGSYTITPLVLTTGILSGLFYGLYTIFGRYALAKYDTITVTTYTFVFGFVGAAVLGQPYATFHAVIEQPALGLWYLGIGIFCTVIPYLLYTWGLQRMEAGKAAIMVAVEPIVGAIIGMTLYHEDHSVAKIAGIVMIITAIIMLSKADSAEPADAAN